MPEIEQINEGCILKIYRSGISQQKCLESTDKVPMMFFFDDNYKGMMLVFLVTLQKTFPSTSIMSIIIEGIYDTA